MANFFGPSKLGYFSYNPGGIFSKKKSGGGGGGGYEFEAYSGLRPPAIDSPGQEILRPTQKQIYDLLMSRSAGVGVGYDPGRRLDLEANLRRSIESQSEDDIRDANASLAARGLSGNVRASEALAGRVRRDSARSLASGLADINIEDLTRANEERDINTARLQDLNTFNFGQENRRADFDLDVYNSQEGNKRSAAGMALEQGRYDQTRSDDRFNDIAGIGLNVADLYLTSQGAPPGTASMASEALSGKGIAPSGGYQQFASLNSANPLVKRRLGRNIVY